MYRERSGWILAHQDAPYLVVGQPLIHQALGTEGDLLADRSREAVHPLEAVHGRQEVTTPGGCTIDGISKLEARGLPIALIEAVEVSSIKAGLLGEDD